ncbi:helix-turn-helix domain-containing protein [Ligilactobacillus murinus]|uniref:Helix-turn-helix domain-containing protein n=1 Tax=Ligilactobacillus murinus TaxID=1622 RepID=A0AAE6WJJ7_9LACO|nr:RodZ domain-containing protein [Ligilactobacillus murinus]NEF82163.1 helix-turn-helix domain-containing protein [Ligilactobacillus murinus]NEF84434.1 helix-turn-helix domain-containing protein [Ligilactobacillus murinus]NEF86691.1 helix-turn-helix domain-containing protein [Ligilactobacillus murinus]NEF88983.1 helix-turn-helix domain-containing protein [Ligilactobacillus murinus]NEF91237.1 helix-turn-helix domain-containing protein [Ligilactobacillus murinus]
MTDIGTILKEARKEKGLTLDDLQQTTKIQKRYLIAIEDGDFAALPGKFYVRAFIKQYAETVGIDPEELLAKLDEDKASKPEEETEATTRTEAVKREEEKTMSPILAGLIRYLPTIIIVSIVVAILGTIYIFAWGDRDRNSSTQIADNSQKVSVSSESSAKSSSSKEKASSSESRSSTSKKESSSTKAKKESKKTTKQKITNTSAAGSAFVYDLENAPATNKIEMTVSDGATAWNAVSANGVQVWQGTLNAANTSQTVEIPENTTTITLNLGNSKATSIKINGKKFDFLKENETLTVRTITLNVAQTTAQ